MPLQLYNSLSKSVEPVSLPTDRPVSIYCCGVTVYDHCHVGHGRIYTLLDTLTRFLSAEGYSLKVIRNITDIDDKILAKAAETGKGWQEIAATYSASMQKVLHEDLGCAPVPHEPKATEAMSTMVAMIEKLIAKGAAYAHGGEVFYHVPQCASYGKLSGQQLTELQGGQRVAVHEGKRHPADFTLWKPSQAPDPSWPSPWGPGRPGWHIECSAMIAEQVDGPLDFHLGGMDLKFPHHENEIAQSESCFDHPLARYWVHGGFVTVNQEKMSKSLKNFQYLNELIEQVGRNATRYFYLSTHYRQPLELTEQKVQQAQNCVRWLEQAVTDSAQADQPAEPGYPQAIIEALNHDLNTPQALTLYHEAVKAMKELPEPERGARANQLLRTAEDLFGLSFTKNQAASIDQLPEEIAELLKKRAEAKTNKDYATADRIRAEVLEKGYQIVDQATGSACFPIKKS